jgi:hypothetical protein
VADHGYAGVLGDRLIQPTHMVRPAGHDEERIDTSGAPTIDVGQEGIEIREATRPGPDEQ